MTTQKTFNVTYTKAIGTIGTILVKASSQKEAIIHASSSCFTGTDFRNAIETTEEYIKPSKAGFQGSARMSNNY